MDFFVLAIDNITATQRTEMANNEVDVTAKVVGIGVFGLPDEIEIKLRECGNDMQVYLKQPPIKHSAYCLGMYWNIFYLKIKHYCNEI